MAVGTSQGGVETGKDMNSITGGRRLCETGQYGIVSRTHAMAWKIARQGSAELLGSR